MKQRTNQADIARMAGVSISTVSRVLADAPGISSQVRREVRKLAQELGYRLPGANQHGDLRQLVAYLTIGRVTGSVAPVYQSIVEGIRAEAERVGMQVSVRAIGSHQKIPADIMERSGFGVLFVGLDPDEEVIDQLKSNGTPVVLVNGMDPRMRVDAVAPANFFGGYQVARHLVAHGHRRILLLAGRSRWTIRRRAEGFQAGLQDAGLAKARAIDIASLDSDHAVAAMKGLLAEEGPVKYTAAFCGSDAVALGVIETLQNNAIKVPDDFSVVGFDDMPYAGMVSPTLTTVHVDWAELGRQAVKLVHAQSQRVRKTALQVQTGVRLIERDSVVKAPAG